MIEIKSYIGTVLHLSEKDTIKSAIEEAVASGADLRGANLRGANLGDANLRGANLGGANLGDANLGGAYLGGANLGGANLRGAYLGDAYLSGGIKVLSRAEAISGFARYCWFAVWTDAGLLLNYGCERHSVEVWRERAKQLAVRYHEDIAGEYERLTLALVAFVEAALPKPVETCSPPSPVSADGPCERPEGGGELAGKETE